MRRAEAQSTGTARPWVALAMAWCAAFVDAVGYLTVWHVYTSHMTGNTAALGLQGAGGRSTVALQHGWAILCFAIGLLAGASLTETERRHGVRSAFAAVLAIEILLLGGFVALESTSVAGLLAIFLLAMAMGMQTVTVTQVRSFRVYTTYVTGTMAQFGEAAAEYAFWARDRTRGRLRRRFLKVLRVTPRHEAFQHAALTAGIWSAYVSGAASGGWSNGRWGAGSLLAPIAVLIVLVCLDLRRPRLLGDTGGV